MYNIPKLTIGIAILMLISFPSFCFSQEEINYNEVAVFLSVEGVGNFESTGLISDQTAYLSISEVFNILKIKNIPSARFDSISGYFILTKDEYLIDKVKNQIIFQGKKIDLKNDDLILTDNSLYMKTNLFGTVFGLNCYFNFRYLSVKLVTSQEIPVFKELKMSQMRENLNKLKGEVKVDTTIGRNYPIFKFGMVDWAIASSQQQGLSPNTQFSLGLGSVVAGGEMNVNLYYNQLTGGFDPQQQNYFWRYANNDHKALRQILIGKIIPQTSSSTTKSLVGVQITNAPTIYRHSAGTFTFTNITEPNWNVELYINNVLVDFVKADASGFFKFDVPIVYGNTILTYKMYGPWGEVRTKTVNSSIPYNFLPTGELEYSINMGTAEGDLNTKIYSANVNYGLNKSISVFGGYEYFSSLSTKQSVPLIGTSVMLFKNMMLAGQYAYGVNFKSSLSLILPSNMILDLSYTENKKGQTLNLNAPLQERRVSLSLPMTISHYSSYTMFSLFQSKFSDYMRSNAMFLYSVNFKNFSANTNTTASFYDLKHITATSNASLSFVLPGRTLVMPTLQYDYNQKKVMSIRCNIEKILFGTAYLNIAYEKNIFEKTETFEFGLRYNFAFMQSGLNTRLTKNANSFTQSARGSLQIDTKNKHIKASENNGVGRGAITFLAFLDLNGDGKKDKNEPKISGLNIRINGGNIVRNDKDTSVSAIELIPYTRYLVEVNGNSFQNVAWRIKKLTYSIAVDPNQFKKIEIPVLVMGEATGTVYVKFKNGSRGMERVYVNFYNDNNLLIGRTLTEGDGYYSYMNFKPGLYIARIDSNQLIRTKMISSPEYKAFTIKPGKEGDFIEGLDFTLQSTVIDSVNNNTAVKDSVETKRLHVLLNKDTLSSINKGFRYSKIPNITGIDSHKVDIDATSQTDKNSKNNSLKNNYQPEINYTYDLQNNINVRYSNFNINPLPLKTVLGSSVVKTLKLISTGKYKNKTQRFSTQFVMSFNQTYALTALKKIAAATGKTIFIMTEGGNYKIWIIGYSDINEAEEVLKQMADLGYQSSILYVNPESILKVDNTQQYSIQVGSFITSSIAFSAQRKISEATGLPVVFISDKGFYKLFVVGFANRLEADDYVKRLASIGIKATINNFSTNF